MFVRESKIRNINWNRLWRQGVADGKVFVPSQVKQLYMIRKSLPVLLVCILSLTACNGNKGHNDASVQTDSLAADTIVADSSADSTIYGTSTEDFGMSTFSMVTDKGDTLDLCRTSEDGTEAQIYGSVEYNDRYAMTTRDNGTAVGVLINLTELDRKVKNYEIVNGKLIVGGDTVSPAKYLN